MLIAHNIVFLGNKWLSIYSCLSSIFIKTCKFIIIGHFFQNKTIPSGKEIGFPWVGQNSSLQTLIVVEFHKPQWCT